MNSLSLYDLSDQYQFLLSELYDQETGVVNETALARLNDVTDSIENKCINITKLFKAFELTQEAIKAEKDRLAKREKVFTNQVNRLKEYLKGSMEHCDIKKIECPQFTISIQKNPKSVEVLNENLIPSEYDKIHKREIDVAKIKMELENGVVIPGVHLVQKTSLRIR